MKLHPKWNLFALLCIIPQKTNYVIIMDNFEKFLKYQNIKIYMKKNYFFQVAIISKYQNFPKLHFSIIWIWYLFILAHDVQNAVFFKIGPFSHHYNIQISKFFKIAFFDYMNMVSFHFGSWRPKRSIFQNWTIFTPL